MNKAHGSGKLVFVISFCAILRRLRQQHKTYKRKKYTKKNKIKRTKN